MIISTIFRNRTTQKILRVVVPLAFWLGAWQLAAIWVDTVYTPGHGALLLPSPLLVWERLDALAARILAEGAQAVVMGLPLREDGSESLTTRQVRNVTQRLKRRLDLPVYYMPELLSSVEAAQDLREAGLSRHKARAVLDRQAAARILASFLAEPGERRRPA